jgi:Zn-dependent protease with chaperone function
MFAARCIGVSLAVFVLLYVCLSLAISRGWELLCRLFPRASARSSADFLFALRILPLAFASAVTVAFTIPSFLLLEPHATDEAIGRAPLALGLCCLLLLGAGMARAALAQMKASRALVKWLEGSTMMESSTLKACEMDSQELETRAAVPVFRTGNNAPTFTVAGLCAPKVLVSEAAVAALNPPELRTALRHEIAHARRYDNLKKLLFRFSTFPGMAGLENAWSEQTEMAADDAAVSSFRDALDLAAALIKVSRLGHVECCELTTALLHSSTALSARVQRLVAWDKMVWDKMRTTRSNTSWHYMLPAAAVTVLGVVATYGTVLNKMHAVTEWLVR